MGFFACGFFVSAFMFLIIVSVFLDRKRDAKLNYYPSLIFQKATRITSILTYRIQNGKLYAKLTSLWRKHSWEYILLDLDEAENFHVYTKIGKFQAIKWVKENVDIAERNKILRDWFNID